MSPLAARDPNESDREVEAGQAGEVGPVLTQIDHVAIAVRDLADALDTYRDAFDVVVEHREVLADQEVEEAWLGVGDSYVKLMAPTDDGSPLAAFLEEHGEGLHHVGYRVDDVAVVLDHLVTLGYDALDPFPRRGTGGAQVAQVRDPHGTLIELVGSSSLGH